MSGSPVEIALRGVVVNKRKLSKKLVRASSSLSRCNPGSDDEPLLSLALKLVWFLMQVFFDLESAQGAITELCIKAGAAFTEAQVKDIRDDIKLGDTVFSRGHADPNDPKIILLSSIAVTIRWKDEHRGEHYVPRCAFTASQHTDGKASQV